MDGRTVKGGVVGRGTHSDGSCDARARGCSQGVRGVRRAATDSLGLDRVIGMISDGGRGGDSEHENSLVDVRGGNLRMLRGRDALSRETESTLVLARRDGGHGSYVHPSLLSPSTHFVQGRSPSHLWWSDVSPRSPDPTSNA